MRKLSNKQKRFLTTVVEEKDVDLTWDMGVEDYAYAYGLNKYETFDQDADRFMHDLAMERLNNAN